MRFALMVIGLLGGLGLFVYGMQLCSEGLEKMAAHRLKQVLAALTANRLVAVLVGILVTVLLQGSSATSVMAVGFVSAGLVGLGQVLSVLLGSAIGTSITAQLIAFRISDYALILVFVGVSFYLFSRRSRRRTLGQAVLGFGLIFYGMAVMSQSMAPLREYPSVTRILVGLEQYPLLGFLLAVGLTIVLQSSAAYLALLMSLSAQGLVGPVALVPSVLGAHLGGTITGLLSSLGAPGRDAKRAGLANFIFKLINAAVFLPLTSVLTPLFLATSSDVSRQIANSHTFFSIVMAIGFLPFTEPLAAGLKRLLPDRSLGLAEARYLDERMLEVPELALHQAKRQVEELGGIVSEAMLANVIPALRYGSDEVLERIGEAERAVDSLYRQISHYITNLGNRNLDDEQMQRGIALLYTSNDLEHVGDIVSSIAQIARKVQSEQIHLSVAGWEELEAMWRETNQNFSRAMQAFRADDRALAGRVVKTHPEMVRLEKSLRYSHFDRMQAGNPQTIASSSAHLDLINDLLQIDGHSVNIAQAVLGIV